MQQHVQNFDCQLYGERKPANECAQPANETRSKNQIQDKIMVVGWGGGGGDLTLVRVSSRNLIGS